MLYIQKPEKTDVVILCGGMGTRLRQVVGDRPKPMVEFDGVPFLSLLMFYASSFGFRRFVLCAGYKGNIISEHYRRHPLKGLEIACALEKEPLGTGGALRHARSWIRTNAFLVLNGDSFARIDLAEFLKYHVLQRADISIALVKASASGNTGKVMVDRAHRVVGFLEKGNPRRAAGCLESAGMYVMNKDVFSWMAPQKKLSLEFDLFPSVTAKRFFGFVQNKRLTDFGTPESLEQAQRLFQKGLI
jgi:NDP-sugar pyrophosphorylase family protein